MISCILLITFTNEYTDSKHFSAGVSMDVWPHDSVSSSLVTYGGYHQDGNKMFILDSLHELGDDDWYENWREGLSSKGYCRVDYH